MNGIDTTIQINSGNLLLNLVTDVLFLILSFLDNASIISLGCVCKIYRQFEITIFRNGQHNIIKPFHLTNITKTIIFNTIISNRYIDLFRLWMPSELKYKGDNTIDCIFNRQYLCSKAASKGSLEILKLILIPNRACGYLQDAARNGHLSTIQWLHENQNITLDCTVCDQAAMNGHFEILKWLIDHNYRYDRSTMVAAIEYGDLEVVKWLHLNGCPRNVDVCSTAIKYNHFEALKWLHENGCEWDCSSSNYAVQNDRLDILKYLHENGCVWGGSTCETAAMYGRLEILKYLHENGCRWNSGATFDAARYGHLEVLKYLHENDCPWGQLTNFIANSAGHTEISKYLHDNGCPCELDGCTYCMK